MSKRFVKPLVKFKTVQKNTTLKVFGEDGWCRVCKKGIESGMAICEKCVEELRGKS